MSILQSKQNLRRHISELKGQSSPIQLEEECREIIKDIEELPVFKKAKTILAYWPIAGEVDLRILLNRWQTKKAFLLPVVKDDYLEIREFKGEAFLTEGQAYGILEPTGSPFQAFNMIDLVIVPGVAFDREGARLGRGKAYYDRLLPKLSTAHKLGVGFSFQIVEKVPSEPHDAFMDTVVFPVS
jgi:5-formyltetrahydrofolate cyclo-ligase